MTLLKKSFFVLVGLGLALNSVLILFSLFGPVLQPADSVSHFLIHLMAAQLGGLLILLPRLPRRISVLPLAVLAAGFLVLFPHFDMNLGQVSEAEGGHRIVQFNMRYENVNPALIRPMIEDAGPDVVAFQEVYDGTTAPVLDELEVDYPHQVRCDFAAIGSVAVLSQTPFEATGCEDGLGLAWGTTLLAGQRVTVASLHLYWPWPFEQWWHIGEISEALSGLPRPLVLAGDFNASTWSAAVAQVEGLSGTRLAPGIRLSLWKEMVPYLPQLVLPIDHVMGSPEIVFTDARLGPYAGSDHWPVIADFRFGGEQADD